MGEVVDKVDMDNKTQMVNSDARAVMVVLGLACKAPHLTRPSHE